MKRINAWAAAATDNLIDSVLTDGHESPETDVVVANADYCQGRWHVPCREQTTAGRPVPPPQRQHLPRPLHAGFWAAVHRLPQRV